MLVLDNEFEVVGLVSAFHYEFPSDFNYEGESHDGWEFVYAETGTLLVVAGTKRILLKTGQLICHKPTEYHCLRPYGGKASAIIFCFFCNSAKMKCFEGKILSVSARQKNHLYDIARSAGQVLLPKDPLDISRDGFMNSKDNVDRINMQQLKNSIEAFLLSACNVNGDSEKVKSFTSRKMQRKELAEGIKCYLTDNLRTKTRICDIAAYFSYSPTSVKKIFKEETGKTINEYLYELKIIAAKKLLSEDKIPVCEISEQLGFTSPSYFSTFFKAMTGVSPSRYSDTD